MSKEALKLLKEMEYRLGSGTAVLQCIGCGHVEGEGHASACKFTRLVSLLEAQPEPGEFWKAGCKPKESGWYLIKYFSNDKPPILCYEKAWFNPDASPKWWVQGTWILADKITHYAGFNEACDRIDRLTEENKRLKRWPDYFAWEREFNRLKYKYKKQEAEIQRLKRDVEMFENLANRAEDQALQGEPGN